jgi:CspA family cold shock protein
MMEGTISTWNPEQLYGFIQPADKSDQVYVHVNEIQSNVPVKEGSKVLFEIKSTDHGREARAVKLLNSESPARGERRRIGISTT